jgi:AraC family transcriptional regulator
VRPRRVRATSGGLAPRYATSRSGSTSRVAAMSPYHFLRTFRVLVGVTPHQFILHARMKRAAVLPRRTSDNVSAIAFAAGFGDLSTFNRRFQRIFALSPPAYRLAVQ